jgi:hypothetical protein
MIKSFSSAWEIWVFVLWLRYIILGFRDLKTHFITTKRLIDNAIDLTYIFFAFSLILIKNVFICISKPVAFWFMAEQSEIFFFVRFAGRQGVVPVKGQWHGQPTSKAYSPRTLSCRPGLL